MLHEFYTNRLSYGDVVWARDTGGGGAPVCLVCRCPSAVWRSEDCQRKFLYPNAVAAVLSDTPLHNFFP